MTQINFRISEDEKLILQLMAQIKGLSITEFVKNNIFSLIEEDRVDLAFNLLREGKIGRKKAWKISGLDGSNFLKEWSHRHAEEVIPDEIIDQTINIAHSLDHNAFRKEK